MVTGSVALMALLFAGAPAGSPPPLDEHVGSFLENYCTDCHGGRKPEADLALDTFEDLAAVQSRKVHLLTEDFVVIPGPRIVETVRTFARCLHPEVEWQ